MFDKLKGGRIGLGHLTLAVTVITASLAGYAAWEARETRLSQKRYALINLQLSKLHALSDVFGEPGQRVAAMGGDLYHPNRYNVMPYTTVPAPKQWFMKQQRDWHYLESFAKSKMYLVADSDYKEEIDAKVGNVIAHWPTFSKEFIEFLDGKRKIDDNSLAKSYKRYHNAKVTFANYVLARLYDEYSAKSQQLSALRE